MGKTIARRVNEPKKSKLSATAAGECPRGGDHEWEEDVNGTYCGKCHEPKPVAKVPPGLLMGADKREAIAIVLEAQAWLDALEADGGALREACGIGFLADSLKETLYGDGLGMAYQADPDDWFLIAMRQGISARRCCLAEDESGDREGLILWEEIAVAIVEQRKNAAWKPEPRSLEEVDRDEALRQWHDPGPECKVSQAVLEEAYALCSTETLRGRRPEIVGLFVLPGETGSWICVGRGMPPALSIVELVPRCEWKGPTHKQLDKKQERAHLYHGVAITHEGGSWVIGDRRLKLMPETASPASPTPRTKVDALKETADLFGKASQELRKKMKGQGENYSAPAPEKTAAAPAEPEKPATAAEKSSAPPAAAGVETRQIELHLIGPNPFQPRLDFNDEELASLATSLIADGQVHPIVVRPVQGNLGPYQLVDGERRLRAAKRAKLKTLRAEVREYSDEELAVLAVVTAQERSDLSDVEQAKQWQLFLSHFKWKQQQLADKFHVSQGEVSNTLRLLKLPDAWQQRVITREISGTHARALVPFAEYPAVLKALEPLVKKQLPLKDWAAAIGEAARENSRPMSGWHYDEAKHHNSEVSFRPTDKNRDELQIVAVKNKWNDGTEQRAFNVARWDELQTAAIVKKEAAEQRRAERAKKPSAKAKFLNAKSGKSSAELARQQAKQFAKRLYAWRVDWLRELCAARLGQSLKPLKPAGQHAPTKVLLYFAFDKASEGMFYNAAQHQFEMRKHVLIKALDKKHGQPWALLESAKPEDLARHWVATLRLMLFDAHEGPQPFLPPNQVESLAVDLEIDLAARWREGQGLKSGYFDLHSKDQLVTLADELGVSVNGTMKKTELIDSLIASPATIKRIPKEILQAKAVR